MRPSPRPAREFHDLDMHRLNREAGGDSAWGNLGDWHASTTYPAACAALADQLGTRLALSPHAHLLDVGFGCGDSLLHWHQRYGVSQLSGLNLSHSQTALARQRLRRHGLAERAAHLHRGGAETLPALAHTPGWRAPDVIIALDCAYHFATRERFLHDAAVVLPAGGRLGLADLVLGHEPRSALERLALATMTRLSRIPRANLVTLATYRRQWQQAGFHIEHCEDISLRVLTPFGAWLRRYKAGLGPDGRGRRRWLRYDLTAAFLRWADRRGLLRYVVCTGHKGSLPADSRIRHTR